MFKVGDRVRCITPPDSGALIKNRVYIVKWVSLGKIQVEGNSHSWYQSRFEKVAYRNRNLPSWF